MFDRVFPSPLRFNLYRMMGIPEPQSLHRLDRKLDDLEKSIHDWAKKLEETPRPIPKRVLLGDSGGDSFDLIREAIPEDLDLKQVKDWNQIFREVKKAQVPLVVMDLALLGAEGVEQVRKLKLKHPKVRVVGLASYLSESLAQAMPDGLDLAGILQRPLNPEQLKESLDRHLS